MDWKQFIDAHFERRARETKEAKRRLEEKQRAREEAEKARLLKKLGDDFQCHVCGHRAQWPHTTSKRGTWGQENEMLTTEHWDQPGDLKKCKRCGMWTCFSDDCLYEGICKNCGGEVSKKVKRL